MIAQGDGDGRRDDDDPWAGLVELGEVSGRRYAYRPGRVLVPRLSWDRLLDDEERDRLRRLLGRNTTEQARLSATVVLAGVDDTPMAVALLRAEGIDARPDHVFFAVPLGQSVSSTPVMFGGVEGAPVMFGGVGGAPVMFGGGLGGAGGGCCCDLGSTGPSELVAPRRSTVSAADPPAPSTREVPTGCRVVVVDTGFAEVMFAPAGLDVEHLAGSRDLPDANGDELLDAAAGHATFIAGVVKRLAPDAVVQTRQVLSTFGDASDSEVAAVLQAVAAEEPAPQIVNLSFAGYTDDDTTPPAIAAPLAQLRAKGVVVVAAAGNDATCRPAWPAATEGVVSVGALGTDGPAWFTNHGGWVRACAPGVDVLSRFFESGGEDRDAILGAGTGWARWSGTSFAAPIVAGVIARATLAGAHPVDAVGALVDDPGLFRLRGFGTVVNERPW